MGNRYRRRPPRRARRRLLINPKFRAWLNRLEPSRCEDLYTHRFAEMTPEKRPQDPHMDGIALRFETLDRRGEYPDTMLQAIN